jgi:hypothetical protein
MLNVAIKYVGLAFFGLSLLSNPSAADPRDPKQVVQEIGGLSADMLQIATVLRISEDIAFWQSVSIMGAQNDWEFTYSGDGNESFAWTLRLYNILGDTLREGTLASQGIARSRVLSAEEKRAFDALFGKYETMRELGEKVHSLLIDGNLPEALEIYENEVIQLRRDIAIAAASSNITIRNRIKEIELDVLLGR